eukprot:COSAG03_NODE_23217_length_282_cov_0.622951_1_plen_35_part_10
MERGEQAAHLAIKPHVEARQLAVWRLDVSGRIVLR